jgi:hypothetical protein
VAAASFCQRGCSGGSTIINQLKASAALALEMATMTARTMTIKTKATAAAAAAWQQHGRIAAVATALLQRGSGSLAAAAAAEAGAAAWRLQWQLGSSVTVAGRSTAMLEARWQQQQHYSRASAAARLQRR